MGWGEILSVSALTALIPSLIGYVLRDVFRGEIETTYEKSPEGFKEEIRQESLKREKSVATAEVVSLWVAHQFDQSRDKSGVLWELQQKYWELALWLDAPTLRL